jgi:elongation factor Ts
MSVSASDIAALRNQTGAGMMDCKNALEEAGGDVEKAVEILRKKGIAKAAKRAGKVAAEGQVVSYIHGEGRIGVLLDLNCETDFVAKTDAFKQLALDIAMHVAAAKPLYVSRTDVPEMMLQAEKDIYRVQLQTEGKPADMIEKIVEGKMSKYFAEVCLLEQSFIKDEEKTIEQILAAKTAEIGEKISVRRFARYELGEGIEREKKDFAAEVAEQLK